MFGSSICLFVLNSHTSLVSHALLDGVKIHLRIELYFSFPFRNKMPGVVFKFCEAPTSIHLFILDHKITPRNAFCCYIYIIKSAQHLFSCNFWVQWWFVNPGSDSPEISLVRTRSAGTNFCVQTIGWFSNPENSLIRKYRPGTNVSGLTNHHCIVNFSFTMLHRRQTTDECKCLTLLSPRAQTHLVEN